MPKVAIDDEIRGLASYSRNGNGRRNASSPQLFSDPIPLDSAKPPQFPGGVFTGWLGDMIHAVAEETETPPELPMTFGLGAVAAVVQRRFSVLVQPNYFEPTNIWLAVFLQSGNRKTAAMQRMTPPLFEWEDRRTAELLPEIEKVKSERKTIEARIMRLRSAAAKAKAAEFQSLKNEIAEAEAGLPEIPQLERLIAQDITTEHAGTLLADNGERIAIFSDEGGIADTIGGRYSNGVPNLDMWLQGHAGAPVRVDRGNRPSINLHHPAITMALSPQPAILVGLASNRAFRQRGLLARLCYLLPSSKLGYRSGTGRTVPDDVARAYRDAILNLADAKSATRGNRAVPHTLQLTDEARSVWRHFWNDIEAMMRPGGRLEHITDWASKLPGAIARISGLLHCADYASCIADNLRIPADTVRRAVAFGQFLIGHAEIAFDVMGDDSAMEIARELWKVISKRRQAIFTAREAWHPMRGRYKRMQDVEAGFDVLIDHGHIIEPPQADDDRPRRAGRPPSRMFTVNPQLTRGWA